MATADPTASNVNLLNTLMGISSKLFDSSSSVQTTQSGGSSTKQTILSQDSINALLKSLMEGTTGRPGLAAVSGSQRPFGMYNTSTRSMLVNDLIARSAAEVAKAGAPEVTTREPGTTTVKTTTPGMMSGGLSSLLLPAAALIGGSKKGRQLIGELFSGSGTPLDVSALAAQDFRDFGVEGVAGLGNSLGYSQGTEYMSPTAVSMLDYADSGANFFEGSSDGLADLFSGSDGFADTASVAADGFDVGVPVGSITKALSGDVQGGVESGIGYAVGSYFGGPIGGSIGSTVAAPVFEAASDVVQAAGDLSVICTELHCQGIMPYHIYAADRRFGKMQSADTIRGYHFWAIPLVRLMKRSQLVTNIVASIALPWAQHMAFKMKTVQYDNAFGALLMRLGKPLCTILGAVVNTFNAVRYPHG